MSKKRIVYLDFIRVFSCLCIMLNHFNASVSGWNGSFVYPNSVIPNFYLGVYLGDIGVTLFFILSGAALMMTYKEGNLKRYYKKRLLNIYPMFWLAYLGATVVDFLLFKGMNTSDLKLLIFTVLGMDGYLGSTWIPAAFSFYKLGEWFLGCILLLYLIFPLLHYGLQKKPVLTWGCALALYALTVNGIPFTDVVPKKFDFYLRIPEILLGMTFMKYDLISKPGRTLGASVCIAAAAILLRGRLNILTYTVCVCIALFAILAYLGTKIKNAALERGIVCFAGLTYPIFLVHHWFIDRLVAPFNLADTSRRNIYMLLFIYFVAVLVLSDLLKKTTDRTVDGLHKLRLEITGAAVKESV